MILLFEGWEKVGKTTLALKCASDLNFQYFRSTKQISSGVNLEQAIQYDWRFMLNFLSQVSIDACFDRSFISQYVYSYMFRKENIKKEYTFKEYEDLFTNYTNKFLNLGGKIIYCYRQEYNDATDDKVDITRVAEAHQLYLDFFAKFNLNPIICKYEDGIAANFNKIKKEFL